MKILKTTLLIAFGAMMVVSCGKYEDGPGFTVLTKKMRLSGTWRAVEYVDSDGTSTTTTDPATTEFTKDGSLILKSNDPNADFTFNGSWEFQNDKENLALTITAFGTSSTEILEILRLTNDELWLKDSDGDITKSEKQD